MLFSQFHFKVPYPSPLSCSLLTNLPNLSTALTAWIHTCSLAQCWQLWNLQQFKDAQWANYGRKRNAAENSETDELQDATLCLLCDMWWQKIMNWIIDYKQNEVHTLCMPAGGMYDGNSKCSHSYINTRMYRNTFRHKYMSHTEICVCLDRKRRVTSRYTGYFTAIHKAESETCRPSPSHLKAAHGHSQGF